MPSSAYEYYIYWLLNPIVSDAQYSERQDKPFSLQIQQLKVDLKLNKGFLFLALRKLMG